MVVIHGRDEDRVNVFAVENLAILSRRLDAGIVHGFASGGVAAVIEVANRDALNAWNTKRCLEVLASANTGPNGGKADGIAGRYASRRSIELLGPQKVLGDGGRSDSSAADLHKLTPGKRRLGHEISALRL
jgi:hypothetical protein